MIHATIHVGYTTTQRERGTFTRGIGSRVVGRGGRKAPVLRPECEHRFDGYDDGDGGPKNARHLSHYITMAAALPPVHNLDTAGRNASWTNWRGGCCIRDRACSPNGRAHIHTNAFTIGERK